jgi:hypothetical protein
MNAEDRFFDLAMKSIARQATTSETMELESLMGANPKLKAEFDRLRADAQLAKEATPLVDAMQAKGAELPGYARQRLQAKVRQTLGQQNAHLSAEERRSFAWNWRWILGFAATAAVLALLIVPSLLAPPRTQIQLAMLDLAGPTRGAGTNELGMFQEKWRGATVTNVSTLNDLMSWERAWLPTENGYQVKVIYDRAAADIRVVGKGRGRQFTNHFPVGAGPGEILDQVQAYIEQETSK